MKNIIKKCCIFTAIIYLVLSLVINIYFYVEKSNESASLMQENIEQTITININIANNAYTVGYMNMAKINIQIFILSLFLGTVTGLILTRKESSKIKFILIYIFGNILWNILVTLIALILFNTHNLEINFFEMYLKILILNAIPYTITYSIILIIRAIDSKMKIKKLNTTLKK